MKKLVSLVVFVSIAAALTGCQSPGRNPAGVGAGAGFGDDALGLGMMDAIGGIPMGDRFSGGTEYRAQFESVFFAYDSSQVAASERAKIEAVSQHLQQNPNQAVIIEGHCDERGSREYNLALGERRALAVRTYLSGLGISADRIQTKSLGEEMPASPGHDDAAWSQNRRGEFVLYY
jgi:peptidoglycan-associated lipoprotein